MTHKAGIRLTNKRSGATSEHLVEFADSEWEQLHAYVRQVQELQTTRFVREGSGVNLTFKWERVAGISWSVAMPPLDDVLAFLHRVRPLVLQDEPASFLKVRKVIARKLEGVGKPLMQFLLGLFQGKEMQKLVLMHSNDTLMNSEEMLLTWLNAHEYHRDRDKQEFLEALHTILPLEWSKGVFLSLLVDKAKAIVMLAVLVELALGKRDTVTVEP